MNIIPRRGGLISFGDIAKGQNWLGRILYCVGGHHTGKFDYILLGTGFNIKRAVSNKKQLYRQYCRHSHISRRSDLTTGHSPVQGVCYLW